MSDFFVLLPLFMMGLISSGHCVGMCGGIMGALTLAIPKDATAKRWTIVLAYNLGRLASYAVMGLLAGLFAAQLAALGAQVSLRIFAGLLMVAMGLYLADWWRGLTKLETLGRYLWVYLQPLSKRIMPVDRFSKALALGAVWGWLPCGLVYSALVLAMTQPNPVLAGAGMLAFGLGTLPAVLAVGLAAQTITRWLQQRQLRVAMAVIVICYGIWTVYSALGHSHHHAQPAAGTHDHSHMHHDMATDEVNASSATEASASSSADPHAHHH